MRIRGTELRSIGRLIASMKRKSSLLVLVASVLLLLAQD